MPLKLLPWRRNRAEADGDGGKTNYRRANLGVANSMYYNTELGAWVEKGQEEAVRKERERLAAPPPRPSSAPAANTEGAPGPAAAPGAAPAAAQSTTGPNMTRPRGLAGRYVNVMATATTTDAAGPSRPLIPGAPAAAPGLPAAPRPFIPAAGGSTPSFFVPPAANGAGPSLFMPGVPAAGGAAPNLFAAAHAAQRGKGEEGTAEAAEQRRGSDDGAAARGASPSSTPHAAPQDGSATATQGPMPTANGAPPPFFMPPAANGPVPSLFMPPSGPAPNLFAAADAAEQQGSDAAAAEPMAAHTEDGAGAPTSAAATPYAAQQDHAAAAMQPFLPAASGSAAVPFMPGAPAANGPAANHFAATYTVEEHHYKATVELGMAAIARQSSSGAPVSPTSTAHTAQHAGDAAHQPFMPPASGNAAPFFMPPPNGAGPSLFMPGVPAGTGPAPSLYAAAHAAAQDSTEAAAAQPAMGMEHDTGSAGAGRSPISTPSAAQQEGGAAAMQPFMPPAPAAKGSVPNLYAATHTAEQHSFGATSEQGMPHDTGSARSAKFPTTPHSAVQQSGAAPFQPFMPAANGSAPTFFMPGLPAANGTAPNLYAAAHAAEQHGSEAAAAHTTVQGAAGPMNGFAPRGRSPTSTPRAAQEAAASTTQPFMPTADGTAPSFFMPTANGTAPAPWAPAANGAAPHHFAADHADGEAHALQPTAHDAPRRWQDPRTRTHPYDLTTNSEAVKVDWAKARQYKEPGKLYKRTQLELDVAAETARREAANPPPTPPVEEQYWVRSMRAQGKEPLMLVRRQNEAMAAAQREQQEAAAAAAAVAQYGSPGASDSRMSDGSYFVSGVTSERYGGGQGVSGEQQGAEDGLGNGPTTPTSRLQQDQWSNGYGDAQLLGQGSGAVHAHAEPDAAIAAGTPTEGTQHWGNGVGGMQLPGGQMGDAEGGLMDGFGDAAAMEVQQNDWADSFGGMRLPGQSVFDAEGGMMDGFGEAPAVEVQQWGAGYGMQQPGLGGEAQDAEGGHATVPATSVQLEQWDECYGGMQQLPGGQGMAAGPESAEGGVVAQATAEASSAAQQQEWGAGDGSAPMPAHGMAAGAEGVQAQPTATTPTGQAQDWGTAYGFELVGGQQDAEGGSGCASGAQQDQWDGWGGEDELLGMGSGMGSTQEAAEGGAAQASSTPTAHASSTPTARYGGMQLPGGQGMGGGFQVADGGLARTASTPTARAQEQLPAGQRMARDSPQQQRQQEGTNAYGHPLPAWQQIRALIGSMTGGLPAGAGLFLQLGDALLHNLGLAGSPKHISSSSNGVDLQDHVSIDMCEELGLACARSEVHAAAFSHLDVNVDLLLAAI